MSKAGAEVATVNVDVSGLPEEILNSGKDLYVRSMNSGKTEKLNKTGKQNARKDKMFMVKVQVAMFDPAMAILDQMDMDIGSMRCYDAKRKLDVHISERNCPEAKQLDSAIRTRGGHPQGLKAYLNAYVTPENELKILYHEMLPMQQW